MNDDSHNSMVVRSKALANKDETLTEKQKIKQILDSDKPVRSNKKRCASIHVSSRWYRAPEICLVEKQYD